MKSHIKTVVLLSTLTALFMAVGHLLGGKAGLQVAFLFALAMNFGAYWFSDKIILKMFRAKEIGPGELPEVYEIVQSLAVRQKLPLPQVYVIDQAAPNAFATGRSPEHAAVAVTTGLLDILEPRELEGVLGHELGHIKNRDTLISSIAATFAGAISMLADMALWGSLFGRDNREGVHPLAGLLGMMLAPLAGLLIQSAISRSREFLADESGAEATHDPLALASALEKIEEFSKSSRLQTGSPAAAHLFIINPFKGRQALSFFSTHPPTRERVKRLQAMAADRIGVQLVR